MKTNEESNVLSRRSLRVFKNLCRIQSPSKLENSLRTYIKKYLKDSMPDLDIIEDAYGNLLITKGELNKDEFYPCVVAHMDTVHNFQNEFEVELGEIIVNGVKKTILHGTKLSSITNKRVEAGGCGDDKAGILVVFQMLRKMDKLKAILTVEEEIGRIGAGKVPLDFLKDIGYFIESDRKGKGDIISSFGTIDMTTPEFDAIMKPVAAEFKFSSSFGSYSDVSTLFKLAKVCAIYFSSGYYNAHLDSEYTVLEELVNAINFAEALLKALGNNKYINEIKVKSSPAQFSYPRANGYYNYYDDYRYEDDFYTEKPAEKKKPVSTEFNPCKIHLKYAWENIVDLECYGCNPVTSTITNMYCSCGEELSSRKHSYYCKHCKIHTLK